MNVGKVKHMSHTFVNWYAQKNENDSIYYQSNNVVETFMPYVVLSVKVLIFD